MAVSAQELRIGNWVKNGRHICKVDAVINYPNKKVIGASGTTLGAEVGFDEFDPIPLTPEILIACGFAVAPKTDPYNGWLINISEDEELRVAPDNIHGFIWPLYGPTPVIVTFLHQLQNLYFALTGTELTYNP